MIVASYFTNDEYAEKARGLQFSLERFGLRFDIQQLPDQGSWQKNTLMKPEFILHKMRKHEQPILWIDADAVVMRPLELFLKPDFDVAVYRYSPVKLFRGSAWHNSGQLWNGTAYFSNSDFSAGVLRAWREACVLHPERLDQKSLAGVLANETEPRSLACLPPEYCWVERVMRAHNKSADPVIVHEASRVSGTVDTQPGTI